MRQFFIILGICAAALALILSVTPQFPIAYILTVLALIFGLIAFYLSKKPQLPKKTIQLIFLLTLISLGITSYKSLFPTPEVEIIEPKEQLDDSSMERPPKTLEELEAERQDQMQEQ
ncbi:FUSC family protein [Gelidibacter salicanalis]|uniref:FUSC family protein n=1 Tax=Gelidibacter salicanalis TaxID=291193 RepID=A0A5C7AIA3_9FLAO|nr:sulfite exporter TauE/SafE family protein [Gelidibacter salicanalis]TXE07714.1 FUSC family protein [Gelidibacter salicanalis]